MMDKYTLVILFSTILLAVICASNGDLLPPRHIKVRGPPIGHPSIKFHNKRLRPPVRVHHIHLNYPPPSPHPVKYVSGPPRKYKPNIPLKSHFNPSPPAHTHTHYIAPIIDNNEGAIHTIPAPNLGPNGDRPIPPPALISSIAGAIKPYNDNIIKVHPITQTKFEGGYEVHEFNDHKEPATSHIGLPYYAPDPDPSVPAPHVPVTRDPFSHPSNGKAPLDLIFQQQLENQQHHGARVSLHQQSHGVGFHGDPNSQFLQAFQDQYKFPQQYEGDYHAQGSQHKVTAVAPDSAELDYDSGAEVRYSFGSAHRTQYQDDQDDAATEEDEEVLEESVPTFGQRIIPKKKNN